MPRNPDHNLRNFLFLVAVAAVGGLLILPAERCGSAPGQLAQEPQRRAATTTTLAPTTTSTTSTTSTTAPTTTVATVPPIEHLEEMEPVSGKYVNHEWASMDGQEYRRLVRFNIHAFQDSRVEYDLGREYHRFTAKVGFIDSASSRYKWHFWVSSVVANDATVLFDEILGSGQFADVNVTVSGVLRLRLSVALAQEEPLSAGPTTNYPIAWGNPTLHRSE